MSDGRPGALYSVATQLSGSSCFRSSGRTNSPKYLRHGRGGRLPGPAHELGREGEAGTSGLRRSPVSSNLFSLRVPLGSACGC